MKEIIKKYYTKAKQLKVFRAVLTGLSVYFIFKAAVSLALPYFLLSLFIVAPIISGIGFSVYIIMALLTHKLVGNISGFGKVTRYLQVALHVIKDPFLWVISISTVLFIVATVMSKSDASLSNSLVASVVIFIVPAYVIFFANYLGYKLAVRDLPPAVLKANMKDDEPEKPKAVETRELMIRKDELLMVTRMIDNDEIIAEVNQISALLDKTDFIFRENNSYEEKYAKVLNSYCSQVINALQSYDSVENSGDQGEHIERMDKTTVNLLQDYKKVLYNVMKAVNEGKIVNIDSEVDAVRKDMQMRGLLD